MDWHSNTLTIHTSGKRLYPITAEITEMTRMWKIETGMCFLFCPHTSASLSLCESYDPLSRADIENYFEHMVPENQPWYQHIYEGADDSPSHIRTTLTHSSISIPIDNGRLGLGTWQGIYLFEHRSVPHTRKIQIRGMQIK